MALVLDANTKEAYLSLDTEVRTEITAQIIVLDKIYDSEIKKLMNDVNIYVARNQNLTQKQIVANLDKDLKGMTGIFAPFKKEIVQDTKRVNYQISEDVFFRGIADETTYDIKKDRLMWQAIFIKTCPDCIALHGRTMTRQDWEDTGGFPREGRTVCQSHCVCELIPVSVMPSQKKMRKPIQIQGERIRRAQKKRGKRYSKSYKTQMLGQINAPKRDKAFPIRDLRKVKKIKKD